MVEPFLFETADYLSKTVMQYMPEFVQNRPHVANYLFGAGGISAVVKGLQWTSTKIERVVEGFDTKFLPVAEKACIGIMTLAPLAYGVIDPQGLNEIITQHPVYTSGMAGVWVGSVATAAYDLHKRSIEDTL